MVFLLVDSTSCFALGKQTTAVALWVSLMPRIWGDCLPCDLSSLTGPRKVVNFQPTQLLLIAMLGALTELKLKVQGLHLSLSFVHKRHMCFPVSSWGRRLFLSACLSSGTLGQNGHIQSCEAADF